MTPVASIKQLFPSISAAKKSFCAAFFLLPVSKTLMFLALAAAFTLFIATGGLAQARQHWRAMPWMAPALLLALLPVLSLLIHGDREAALSHMGLGYYWLIAFLTFFVARRYAVVPWLRAFLYGMALAFVYVEASKLGWIAFPWTPASMSNYILYSQLLAMAIVVLSVLYRHEASKTAKRLYLAVMAAFYLGLVTGDGRSGMLAVAVLLPFIVINIFPRAGMGKVLLGCVFAALVLIASPRVQTRIDAAVNDLQLMQNDVQETSLGYRMQMWRVAVDVIRAHPVLGSGADGFRTAWHSTPRTGEAAGFVEPHNAYLFYASSYGLFGLAALLWLYVAMLRTGWVYRNTLAGGVVLGFAVICMLGSFTNTMFMGATSHAWLMLFIGLQGALAHAASKPANPAARDAIA